MKAPAKQVVPILCSLALLMSCSKINLHGGRSQAAPGGGANSTVPANGTPLGAQQQGGGMQANSASPPVVDGDWEVDYEYGGSTYIGNVTFSQSGTALAGSGADQDGKQWQLDAGQIQGTKVAFGKKYAGSTSQPVIYTGELKYLQLPEYTGWAMEGTYSAQSPDGKSITGKWVANPTAPAPVAESAPSEPGQGPGPGKALGGAEAAASHQVDHIGDARPSDISGHYDGSYNFNFKKIKSKMWIESDCKKVIGRGYDILEKVSVKTKAKGKDKVKEQDINEHFIIEKGWYDYPKVTLIRQYIKGRGARETRTVIFRGQLSSNGRDIVMKGETQFGGSWDARRL